MTNNTQVINYVTNNDKIRFWAKKYTYIDGISPNSYPK